MIVTMIEKVAHALYVQSDITYSDKAYWKRMAKAAIEAMKEPTEEMLKAEGTHHNCHMCGGHSEGYKLMIEAALKE